MSHRLPEVVDMAVEAVTKAPNIHFYGAGASHIIALDAQQKFSRIHKNATAFSDIHMVAVQVANVQPNDVVFGISFSGETQEIINIMDLSNKYGATSISLTSFGSSSVSDRAGIKLYTASTKEALLRSGATSSRLAQLHVIDILFMCVAAQSYSDSIKYIDRTREAINFIREKPTKNGRIPK